MTANTDFGGMKRGWDWLFEPVDIRKPGCLPFVIAAVLCGAVIAWVAA